MVMVLGSFGCSLSFASAVGAVMVSALVAVEMAQVLLMKSTMTMVVPCLWMQSVAIVMHSVISLPSSIVQKDRFSKQSLL